MSLGSDVGATLPFLREQAESRMTEMLQIGRFGDGVDPDTGDAVRVLEESRYEGKGRVRYPTATVSRVDGAGTVIAEQDIIVSIPTGSAPCYEGDEVLVVTSTADALLAGRRYRVSGPAAGGQTTAHRYPVTEAT